MKTISNLIERLEKIFLLVAYADAADMKDLLNSIKNKAELVHRNESRSCDNELCYLDS